MIAFCTVKLRYYTTDMVGEGEKTKCCTQEASLVGTSMWQKLTSDEGLVKEKSLSGTSKLLPSLGDEGTAKTVKLQSYDSSVTMKEALAVLKEAAIVDLPSQALKADDKSNSKEITKEPSELAIETSPDVSPMVADAGRSVHPEEVAELRALLEEAIQDDSKHEELKNPKTLWLEEAILTDVGICGSCNPSKAEGPQAPIKSVKAGAVAMSEDLYESSLSAVTQEKSHTWISNISWAVSSAANDSLAYSHSEGGYSRSLAEKGEELSIGDPIALDDEKIKAFASAVQGTNGLGEELQKDLLELLQALPGYKA
eukprot:symbB.v1.2.032196.t1/scaffold3830.1/size49552/5